MACSDTRAEEADASVPVENSPARVTTRSASGRFLVVGSDSADNSQYTRWAEEIAGRLERLLAIPLPPLGREPIEIVRVSGRLAGPAMRIDCRPEGATRRRLTINESRTPDYERLQEALCALLLDGYVQERQRVMGARPGEPVIPQWFSMGLSQNLATETRNRNRKIVTGWLPASERPAVASVLEWRRLPDGWPRKWALCGVAVHWLGSMKDGAQAYALILDGLAGGEPVGSEWVANRIFRSGSPAAMELEWQEWLTRQSRAIQEFGQLSTGLMEQVKSELDLVYTAAPAPGQVRASTQRLTPGQVAEEKNRSVPLRLAAAEKVQKIRALTLGKAPELVEVGEAYCRFFDAISEDAWTLTVNRRLSQAETAFDRLASLTRAREAYLDEIEREMGESSAVEDGSTAGSDEPVLEKSRIDTYLDDAEKRFHQSGR
jgi:hypothetical protein